MEMVCIKYSYFSVENRCYVKLFPHFCLLINKKVFFSEKSYYRRNQWQHPRDPKSCKIFTSKSKPSQ